MEVAHVGAVLVLLAQVFSVERLVLLLSEHLSLVIAFELFLAFMMLGILLTVVVDLLAVLVWIHVSVKTSKEISCANRLELVITYLYSKKRRLQFSCEGAI